MPWASVGYNNEQWLYSRTIKQVDGRKLLTYRDLKSGTRFICFREVEGKLVEWSLADEIERAFETGEINK